MAKKLTPVQFETLKDAYRLSSGVWAITGHRSTMRSLVSKGLAKTYYNGYGTVILTEEGEKERQGAVDAQARLDVYIAETKIGRAAIGATPAESVAEVGKPVQKQDDSDLLPVKKAIPPIVVRSPQYGVLSYTQLQECRANYVDSLKTWQYRAQNETGIIQREYAESQVVKWERDLRFVELAIAQYDAAELNNPASVVEPAADIPDVGNVVPAALPKARRTNWTRKYLGGETQSSPIGAKPATLPFKREGTAILDAKNGSIVYEADCFESEAQAEQAVELLNNNPEWEAEELWQAIDADDFERREVARLAPVIAKFNAINKDLEEIDKQREALNAEIASENGGVVPPSRGLAGMLVDSRNEIVSLKAQLAAANERIAELEAEVERLTWRGVREAIENLNANDKPRYGGLY